MGNAYGVADYGDGTLVASVSNDSSTAKYQQFQTKLAAQGYTLYADNSAATELAANVKTATYTKGDEYFTVTHMANTDTTYLSHSEGIALSPHLKYDAEYVANNIAGAKTTLSNLEMYNFGNSLVIQLKNGHFIVSDGGMDKRTSVLSDAEYLLQFMEGLVPEGTKPVVEAWVISHFHDDHCGLMKDFANGTIDASRIYVEGIYANEPSGDVFALDTYALTTLDGVKTAVQKLNTRSGEHPEIYRMQTGQRYYFNDITMDIVFAQEQLPVNEYANVEFPNDDSYDNFNDSSTWCMFTIEGQKVLFTGDADKGSMDYVMKAYSQDYLNLTALTTQHHSWNPYQDFVDYLTADGARKIDAVIVTSDVLATSEYIQATAPDRVEWYAPNSVLEDRANGVFGWGNGSVTLTFPYTPGDTVNVATKQVRR